MLPIQPIGDSVTAPFKGGLFVIGVPVLLNLETSTRYSPTPVLVIVGYLLKTLTRLVLPIRYSPTAGLVVASRLLNSLLRMLSTFSTNGVVYLT